MAWDFAAEIHSLTNYDADDASTTGTSGETLSLQADRWLVDGAKEIINILPEKLKQKCVSATGVGTDFKVDLDGLGEILYVTRENADSGFLVPCREIPSMYGGLAFSGSGHMMYEPSITDPVYWIDGDTSGAATLYVKPTPTANQPAIVHHVKYPANSATWGDSANALPTVSTSIPNFPDEAEYLVVLYACIKAIQYQMITLQTNSAIDTTAMGLVKTAIDQAASAADKFEQADSDSIFGDELTFLTADSQLTEVKDALYAAKLLFDTDLTDDDGSEVTESVLHWLEDEDTEMVSATISAMNAEISRASANLSQWTSIGGMRAREVEVALSEAKGYISEISARMERDSQKYTWYQSQYESLKADYQQGVNALGGGRVALTTPKGGAQ